MLSSMIRGHVEYSKLDLFKKFYDEDLPDYEMPKLESSD